MSVASAPQASSGAVAPALDAITESDLRRDIYALAGDAMRGREGGTMDEMRATVWVAERAREAGLEPAGDDGTYFQWWPMRRTRLSESSRIAVGARPLSLWRDAIVTSNLTATVDLPLVFLDNVRPGDTTMKDLAGKAAVAVMTPPARVQQSTISPYPYRYATAAIAAVSQNLLARGAGAAIVVADAPGDSDVAWGYGAAARSRGTYGLDTGQAMSTFPRRAPTIWVRHGMLEPLRTAAQRGERLTAEIIGETFSYPSANVVARVRGTDPARRDEYVLFSGHQDHDGVRATIDGDSIWNGADDNASVAVALLAIGRAVAKRPPPRSALFVWHGSEERGLLGSRWFVRKPLVPKSSIVAVLNGDMIGRNTPDSAALLGWRPPYRNSKALATAALEANARLTHFKLDTLWDLPTHPEGWYFRSDHLPYAQAGIPAIFFTTLLHADYHTPRDEPSRIDIPKLARMTQWMYATGWTIATASARPDVDPGFNPVRRGRGGL